MQGFIALVRQTAKVISDKILVLMGLMVTMEVIIKKDVNVTIGDVVA